MDWNVHSLSSRLKVAQCSSLNYKVTVINIFGLSVVLKIIIDHLIRYIARTPAPISYCPKMPAPIPLFQLRKFLLKLSWTTPFQLLYQTAYAWGGSILQMHMNVIFGNNSFQYSYILSFANLYQQSTATYLNVTL